MQIKEAATKMNQTVRMLRKMDELGYVIVPKKENGYRTYDDLLLNKLKVAFILRELQTPGVIINKDIREILHGKKNPLAIIQEDITKVEELLNNLRTVESVLLDDAAKSAEESNYMDALVAYYDSIYGEPKYTQITLDDLSDQDEILDGIDFDDEFFKSVLDFFNSLPGGEEPSGVSEE